ncbi:type II secretion system F family protein [Microbacterium sp. NPDC096154]|uniref:type II secretion system F family protein n=1 Tax=Microbacterium sp. NPDC096154 TaxID=3155549 RepID=UPI0033241BC4
MSVGVIALLLLATLVLLLLTVAALQESRAFQQRMVESADPMRVDRHTLLVRLDERLAGTKPGKRLAALLAGAGLARWSAAGFLLALAAGVLAVGVLALPFLGRIGALVAAGAVVFGVKRWLDARRQGRVDRFVAQLPEVARLLANGADAGLAVRRGIELAAREMEEPAASELGQVAAELAVGRTLGASLAGLSERLPSRELAVLVQTLVIQARAGGALVTALSGIAATLEERRQLRREIRSATVGSSFMGYMVAAMGIGAVVLMNVLNPGVLDEMFGNLVGQIVLLVAGVMFALGFLLMRRLGKVPL